MPGPKPNEDVGKKMLENAGGEIGYDEAELTALAAEFTGKAASLRAVSAQLDAIPDAVKSEMGEFEAEAEPDTGTYEDTGSSTREALTKVKEKVNQLAAQAERQAGGLAWLVQHMSATQAESAKAAEDIDTDLETVPC